jgi:hypothetical protein
MAHKPVGIGGSFSVSAGAATTSIPISVLCDTIRIVPTANCFVKIDGEPTAATTDYYAPSVKDYTLALSPASGRVAGIITGATTFIDFPEGTASPFSVNDYVSLVSVGQSYYNFTHKRVTEVLTSSGVNGYYSRRIIVDHNSAGIVTAYTTKDADLRKSIKVSAYGLAAGALYYQQVQISGDA